VAKILSIIPYEFYPPKYGGALRCYHLLRGIAKENEVTLLTVQPLSDFNSFKEKPAFKNVRVLSSEEFGEYTTVFNLLPQRIARAVNSRMLQGSVSSKGNLYLLKTYPALRKLLKEEKFDAAIYENLECFSVLRPYIERYSPDTLHIYDAHNVDSELWYAQSVILKDPELIEYGDDALIEESLLHQTTDLCFCCSAADKEKLIRLNKGSLRIVIVPNGVDTREKTFDNRSNKFNIHNLLFCGTLDYAPNKEGLLWFCEKVFPLIQQKIPDITITIIGKMNNNDPYTELKGNPAIHFIGQVESVNDYYMQSSVAVVPLLSGSGTRLKILEAMSFGNPVVSTTIGSEGIDATNGEELLRADGADRFARAVTDLLLDPDLFNRLRTNANRLVNEKYEWDIISEKMNLELKRAIEGNL